MINALKSPSFFRPTSRPSSPVLTPLQEPVMGGDRAARPLSKLSLSTFRRPSSSPASGPLTHTVTQDGSYMEVLSLKLSEAVSKALAQPSGPGTPHELIGGRRPIPPGRGRALGALIASEVKASRENPHLYRAIIRTLHRPLSVLLSNLSSDLLLLLSSSSFHASPTSTPQPPHLNAVQQHAVGLATVAAELLETFDELGLGLETGMRGDGLKATREGLASVVKKVLDPLMSVTKNDLVPLLDALEYAHPAPSASKGPKSPVPHPSVATLQTVVPIYARVISRYVTSVTAENALASLLISLIWRSLVALANRSSPLPSPPTSPVLSAPVQKTKETKRHGSATPPATPPSSRFTLKLPPSRPPTPPGLSGVRGTTVAADARALFDLLNMLPRPSTDKQTTRLAREAVDEAFEGLSALTALLEAVQVHLQAPRGRVGGAGATAELQAELEVLTADLPLLIALPVLLRAFAPASSGIPTNQERTVASMLGLSEEDYRKGCLSGFGRAEECAAAVGQRVLDVLRAEGAAGRMEGFVKWLERQIAVVAADH